MAKIYFTLTGTRHYYGSDFLKSGMKIQLEKEPDNKYDPEAIQVKLKGMGKIGYVANSPYTMIGESMSAGRIYDKIDNQANAKTFADITTNNIGNTIGIYLNDEMIANPRVMCAITEGSCQIEVDTYEQAQVLSEALEKCK